jgi:type I restriction enzyme S subunit
MVIKEGYKQTEIGEIPKDWEVKSFKEVSYMKGRIGWQGLNQTEFTMNSNEPFLITGMNFKNGAIRWDEVYHISEERYEIAKDIQLKDDDVLMTKDGTIGKLLYVENIPYPYKASLNSHLLVFRPLKNSYNPKYLYYNLLSPYFFKYIELTKSGTTFFGISQTSVGEYKIILPPLAEQIAIATALSDADGLITGLEKLIAKKRNIKQGAMQQLLQPKEGWEVKKLGEVATIVRGASPRPIEDTKWFDNQSPIGWVRISDVTKSKKVLTETTQKLSDLGVKNSRLVENGNLIMSICATVGRPIFTTFDVCIHDGFVVFRNPHIDKEYLYYFLTFIEDNWSKSGQTGSQMNLNTALINKTEIPFPKSNEEQTRIANIFSDMDAELSALEQKLEKYKKVKLGMMQELLTGKTRLN